MAIDPDVTEALAPILRALEEMRAEIETLKSQPSGTELFAARDNFETALFGAMQGMTDEEQVEFFRLEAERLNART